MNGSPYGVHRVIEPKGVLPQAAMKIDNAMEIFDNEILIDVEALNIDSASFTQLRRQAAEEGRSIGDIIMSIVARRGKMHNPVTGSGGMLIGTVAKMGTSLKGKHPLREGDRIASMVSLTLTPLKIDRIRGVKEHIDRVEVDGKAILFESGIFAKLPTDFTENVALAVLDVAGAPAKVEQIVKPTDTVLFVGLGKSALLGLEVAMKKTRGQGRVIALGRSEGSCKTVEELGLADVVLRGDANDPVEAYNRVYEATGGKLADIVVNVVNIPGTEGASILCTKEDGTIYFFSMATSFTTAALTAEGLGKDITMLIGSGYTKGWADMAFDVLRKSDTLRRYFEEKYGG